MNLVTPGIAVTEFDVSNAIQPAFTRQQLDVINEVYAEMAAKQRATLSASIKFFAEQLLSVQSVPPLSDYAFDVRYKSLTSCDDDEIFPV